MDPVDAVIFGGSTLANGIFSQRAAAYNQRMTERNTRQNFKYAMLAQRMAPVNEVAGLRAAGLSPVFANGAQGMATSSGSSGTAQAPSVDPSTLLLNAQIENIKAQTAKTEAETKGQDIKNTRDKTHDLVLSQNLNTYFTKLAQDTSDDELKAFFEYQAEIARKGEANLGSYDALVKYFDLQGKSEDAVARKLDKKLSAYLSELRWNKVKGHTIESSDFVKALASLDSRQSDLLAAEASNILASKKSTDELIGLTKAKINLTNEQITQVKAAAEAMNDQNIMHWIDKGEYAKAFLAGLIQIFGGFAAKGRSYATGE